MSTTAPNPLTKVILIQSMKNTQPGSFIISEHKHICHTVGACCGATLLLLGFIFMYVDFEHLALDPDRE